ncbi:hypothetical protein ABS71_08845 [bacterium SCN 62-11]|nr:2Fe-2S iron-sulfur cluster binding domain-containing protein [Candidatus Eremiobacteraeota bacterium]ODT69753.1 MAG: hypothetical protein ABS71_08845 [bacterium SCN 62-11]
MENFYCEHEAPAEAPQESDPLAISRRTFLVATAAATTLPSMALPRPQEPTADFEVTTQIHVNGQNHQLAHDSRATLLDTLRDKLHLSGTKKGCDHGQCGACTVLVNGRRVLSCLTLAASCDGDEVTTIEGLGTDEQLHPMQQAFIDQDAFQCGYCTPGQICSAVALLKEARAGQASYLTPLQPKPELSDAEIRERMSGNICRCGAYLNIVKAIRQVQGA